MYDKVTIVIPVYNEGENIIHCLTAIKNEVKAEYKITVVYDSEEDTTLPALDEAEKILDIKVARLRNKYGRGALNAIKSGLESADTEYVIVTMADLSDPPEVMNDMIEKADREQADIVCASRYMRGGRQIGGPLLKGLMSRCAGLSLHALVGFPTHDPTNSFKLYRKRFLEQVKIESTGGFELGIELVVKAWELGYKVVEVPTTWRDRTDGKSNFKLWKWLPLYLRWYFAALSAAPKADASVPKYHRLISITAWTVLFLAMCWNFFNVHKYAMNVPYWDEWDYISALEKFSWENIVSVHVQHRIIFTRLQFYLGYWLNGLDFRQMILFNWFLYLAMVFSVMRLFWKNIKTIPYFPLFFLPFFSDLAAENLLWAGQSQFHFLLLFFMSAAYYGFVAERTLKNKILFCLFAILSIFSMSPLPAIILLMAWCIREALFYWSADWSERKRITISALGVVSTVCLAAGIFFIDYIPGEVQPVTDLSRFMECAETSFSRAFRLQTRGMSLKVWDFLTLLYVIPVIFFLFAVFTCKKRIITENGAAFAMILWSVLFALMVNYTRNEALAERHMEAVLVLTPAIASILAMLPNRFMRNRALIWFLVYMIFPLCFSFTFNVSFRVYNLRSKGYEILMDWHNETPRTDCLKNPHLYHSDLSEKAGYAERIGLSYTRDPKKEQNTAGQ